MKRLSIITLLILFCLTGHSYAQTQQGYVKTKGRMMNGKYYAGKRISDATVQVKDRSAVRSRADGSFSFPVPGKSYSLQQVQKQGFVLLDQDVLYRQYTYSSNPLVIVMEDKAQLEADRRRLKEQVESITKEQLRRREAELEALKEQNKITEEKYHELLDKLNKDYDQNEQLVKDMVEQYNKIDFDQEDELNRRISDCIINGRLDEADSLLNTKGDVDKLIEQLNKHHAANEQARATLSKSEAAEDHERQNIADVCYKKFQIYKMRHMDDSAKYYIELRADLDSANPNWQLEAMEYVGFEFVPNNSINKWFFRGEQIEINYIKNKLNKYVSRALKNAHDLDSINVYLLEAEILCYYGEYFDALNLYEKCISDINDKYRNNYSLSYQAYTGIGRVYFFEKKYDKAILYEKTALEIANNHLSRDMHCKNTNHVLIGHSLFDRGDTIAAFNYLINISDSICKECQNPSSIPQYIDREVDVNQLIFLLYSKINHNSHSVIDKDRTVLEKAKIIYEIEMQAEEEMLENKRKELDEIKKELSKRVSESAVSFGLY